MLAISHVDHDLSAHKLIDFKFLFFPRIGLLNSLYFSSTRCTLRVMLLSERENAISETEISYFLLRKPIMTTIYGERVGGMARGSS